MHLLQWNKCKGSNCEDSNDTWTINPMWEGEGELQKPTHIAAMITATELLLINIQNFFDFS